MFQAGAARYAIAGAHVVEVLPAIVWAPVAGAAAGVIGIVNYHGMPVPLVDARVLLGETKADPVVQESVSDHALRLYNRILIVRPADAANDMLVGVLVDRVLGTTRREVRDFTDAGVVARGEAYLGPVLTDDDGIVQRIEPSHILPEPVRDEVLRQWSGVV